MLHSSRQGTLTDMTDLRRLPLFQPGARIPKAYKDAWAEVMSAENRSAEECILEIAELAYVLQADGFPVREIFRRIGLVHTPKPDLRRISPYSNPLYDYVVAYLNVHAPIYLELGGTLLKSALALAELWAELSAEQGRQASWPPPEMLSGPGPLMFVMVKRDGDSQAEDRPAPDGSIEHLDALLAQAASSTGRSVRRMKARAVPGDELRNYSTGGESFRLMMGSAGIALVRQGRSIDYMEMLMN